MPSLEDGINFLADLAHGGLGYSAVNTARSALSSVISLPDGISFGEHYLVKKLLKGVFALKPSLPRYSSIWDVDVVLNYLLKLSPASKLGLKVLTLKTVMLIALLTGQRCQTIHALDTDTMDLSSSKCVFYVNTVLKQTRPGHHLEPIVLTAYAPDRRWCIVTYLKQYLEKTKEIRGSHSKLFISFNKPHNPVSKDTISRWIKHVLDLSGIDTSVFQAHSVRAAATSKARCKGLPLDVIMKAAGWSQTSTFSRYYKKSIGTSTQNFGNLILSSAVNTVSE